MKCLTTLSVVGILISCAVVNAQNFTVQPGKWSSPSTWLGGIVPDASSGVITINHKVSIPADTSLSIDEVIIQDTLIVEAGVTLTVSNGSLTDVQVAAGGIKVFGKVICTDGATFSGMTAANSFFQSGSTYEHQYSSTAGEPPLATWHTNSTLEITGYVNSHSLNNSNWTQSFGNVVYDCPNQAVSSFVEGNGNLKGIKGNFIVRNTNGGVFRLVKDDLSQNIISIGGDFIIEGKSEVWFSLGGNITINVGGNFEYRSTATASSYLTTTGTGTVNVNGDFIMNSAGLLRFASATASGVGTLRVKGEILFEAGQLAVLPTGSGVLECNGTSLQNFTALGSIDPGITIVINNPGGIAFNTNAVLGGDIHVASGSSLIFPTGNIELQRDFTIESGGQLTSGNGTLLLSGSVNQELSLAGNSLHNLTINKTSGTSVALSSSINVGGTITIQSSDTDIVSNGNLTLLSTSDDGGDDARVEALPTGSSIIGDVTVQRYMSGEGKLYRYLSSPVQDANVASWKDDFPITGTFDNPTTGPGINSTNPSLYFYDETVPSWTPYPSTGLAESNPLVVGKGYSAFIREPLASTTWDVTGTLNQGEVDFQVTYTNTNSPNEGWNLVGNPYPSPIDWNAAGWDKVNIENEIVVRDNGQGTFLYWDGAIGSLGSGRIAVGQAFWVQTNAENPSLKIQESAKTGVASSFYRTQQSELDFLELTVDRGDAKDKAYLRMRSNATQGYDPTDVLKWSNDFINLSFEAEGNSLAIASTDYADCSSIPLGLYFTKKPDGSFVKSPKGNYSLSINRNGIFTHSDVEVFDAYTNKKFNLSSGNYAFSITSDSASFKKDRFSLILSALPFVEPEITSGDSILCGHSFYQVRVDALQDGVRYSLFLNGEETDTYLTDGEELLTLKASTEKFLEGENSYKIIAQNACYKTETQQGSFYYTKELKPAIITEEKGLLISNYGSGNQWYFNANEIVGEVYSTLEPESSGLYKVKVMVDQCQTTASYEFTYQDENVSCYPNPVETTVTLIAPKDELINHLKIFDCQGNAITEIQLTDAPKQNSFSITDIPTGIYLLELATNKGRYFKKILKN